MNDNESSRKAILFDMVGVLLFKNADFQTDKEIESVESLFNYVDDTKLILDIKTQLHYTEEKQELG